jgi:alkylhydroperoxidase/carboxymuconolactone decarboxylase family protein YurZ
MGALEDGMEVRRRVLGQEHVDRATAATTDLDRSFREWITESVWGGIWTRPGIDIRSRSMVTIAILGALNHEELELHLRAARNTGVTPESQGRIPLPTGSTSGSRARTRRSSSTSDTLRFTT